MAIKYVALCLCTLSVLCTVTDGRPNYITEQHLIYQTPIDPHGMHQQMHAAHQHAVNEEIRRQQYRQAMNQNNRMMQEELLRRHQLEQEARQWQEYQRFEQIKRQQQERQRQQHQQWQYRQWQQQLQQQRQQRQQHWNPHYNPQTDQQHWEQQTDHHRRLQQAYAMAELYRQHYNHMINQYNSFIQHQQQMHANRVGPRFETANQQIHQLPEGGKWGNYFGHNQNQVNRQAEQFSSQILTDLQTGRVTQQDVADPNFFIAQAVNNIGGQQATMTEEAPKQGVVSLEDSSSSSSNELQQVVPEANVHAIPSTTELPMTTVVAAAASQSSTVASKDSNDQEEMAGDQDSDTLSELIITYNPTVQRYEYVHINEPIRQGEANL